jgi:hypothetical protein
MASMMRVADRGGAPDAEEREREEGSLWKLASNL